MGIQAVGKSTFFNDRFSKTHIRINLDMLRTRHRENAILKACFEASQSFVVDTPIQHEQIGHDICLNAGRALFGPSDTFLSPESMTR